MAMNDHKKNDHAPDEDSARKEYAEMSGGAEQGSGEPTEEDVLLRLAAENEEMKDKALRLAAEMENLRRRTARDVLGWEPQVPLSEGLPKTIEYFEQVVE